MGAKTVFTVSIEIKFTAGHQITTADGQTEPLHDHYWVVDAAVSTEELDNAGFAIDFHELKKIIEKIITPWEGSKLEDQPPFKNLSASAENVAKYIYEKSEPLLPEYVKLEYIGVREAPGCRAKYSK